MQEPLVDMIKRWQIKFIGNCLRKNTGELIHKYALYEPEDSRGKRKPGKPHMTYREGHKPPPTRNKAAWNEPIQIEANRQIDDDDVVYFL